MDISLFSVWSCMAYMCLWLKKLVFWNLNFLDLSPPCLKFFSHYFQLLILFFYILRNNIFRNTALAFSKSIILIFISKNSFLFIHYPFFIVASSYFMNAIYSRLSLRPLLRIFQVLLCSQNYLCFLWTPLFELINPEPFLSCSGFFSSSCES